MCQFGNRFIPDGRITILKTTLGGTGTTRFEITPVDDAATQYHQTPTPTRPGAVDAGARRPDTEAAARQLRDPGDRTDRAPTGSWVLMAVTCGGTLKPARAGSRRGELTRTTRRLCRFVNQPPSSRRRAARAHPPTPAAASPLPARSGPAARRARRARPRGHQARPALRSGSARPRRTRSRCATWARRRPSRSSSPTAPAPARQRARAREPGRPAISSSGCFCRSAARSRRGGHHPDRVRATGPRGCDNVAVAGSATGTRLSNNVDRARMRVRRSPRVIGGRLRPRRDHVRRARRLLTRVRPPARGCPSQRSDAHASASAGGAAGSPERYRRPQLDDGAAPGRSVTASSPPSSSARSHIPAMPYPGTAWSASPCPSSLTEAISVFSCIATRSSTRRAPAWRRALVRASPATAAGGSNTSPGSWSGASCRAAPRSRAAGRSPAGAPRALPRHDLERLVVQVGEAQTGVEGGDPVRDGGQDRLEAVQPDDVRMPA